MGYVESFESITIVEGRAFERPRELKGLGKYFVLFCLRAQSEEGSMIQGAKSH